MYKSCSICGKIHDTRVRCKARKITYQNTDERQLRNKYCWEKKSKEIRERSNYLCEVCRDQNIFTYDNLEVHHIEKLRDRKDLLLENNNLICLCTEHHKQADKGQIDKQYLSRLAMEREQKLSPHAF